MLGDIFGESLEITGGIPGANPQRTFWRESSEKLYGNIPETIFGENALRNLLMYY